jgi:hypothetical protein
LERISMELTRYLAGFLGFVGALLPVANQSFVL